MSKLDAQRAMREANYAAKQSGAPKRSSAESRAGGPATPTAPRRRATRATDSAPGSDADPVAGLSTAASAPATGDSAEASTGTCGHRSMNGRTCTRPAGHDEKNHRYS